MTKLLILDSQIRHASEMDDLDAACLFIQDLLGVTDGGLASVIFSGFDWEHEALESRMEQMRAYIESECAEGARDPAIVPTE